MTVWMIQPIEAAASSAIHPNVQPALWKQNEDNMWSENLVIKWASAANLLLSISAFQDATDVFSFSGCQQYYTHSHAEVSTAVAGAWMNAMVIILTLSEYVYVCVASVVVCSFVMTAGPFQNKFKHRLMLHALANQPTLFAESLRLPRSSLLFQ